MNLIKRIAEHVCYIWFAVLVGCSFIAIYPALFIALQKKEWYAYAQLLRKGFANFCMLFGGIRIKQIVEQPLSRGPYIVTPNHTSKLDNMTLVGKLGIDMIFLGLESFKKIPLFGYFLKTIDIPVNPKNKTQAAIAYRRVLATLEDGKNMIIFPEGTISRITPTLSKFKSGAFKLAIEAQVDILPVTVIGHWKSLPENKKFRFWPGTLIHYVHGPISTKDMTLEDVDTLKQKVFDIIASKLEEHGYKQRID
jgi:1-acyl-sn-glycerol-3-phosphate acyltransferase